MKFIGFFLTLFLLSVSFGCGASQRQVQAEVANGIANAGNTALPMLLSTYQAEGDKAIASSQSREEAETKIALIKKEWEPRWKAWEAFRAAHDIWATALEKDLDVSLALAELQRAYCALMVLWPKTLPSKPVVPLSCPETP